MASSSVSKTPVTNARGIPAAVFIESVEDHLDAPGTTPESALKELEELLAKYRFMEQSTLQKRRGLEEKAPELKRTLEMVEMLRSKKEAEETLETHFELADTLYARAEVAPVEEVYLWLGANTMLSYPLEEAHQLLSSKLTGAEKKLLDAKEDQAFLRDQITTTEVNVARVYNLDVLRRRQKRELEAAQSGDGEKGRVKNVKRQTLACTDE